MAVELPERFVHGGVAFLLAGVFVAYSAFVGFGDNVYTAYTSTNCSSLYFDDINKIRSATQSIWLAGFGCIAWVIVGAYHKVFEHHYVADAFVFLGICGIVLAGLFTILVALTGACSDPVGSPTNGEVYDFAVFSGFAIALALIQTMLTDVVAPAHKSYTVAGTTVMTALVYVCRTILVGILFKITQLDKADFLADYVRAADLASTACVNASRGLDTEVYDTIRIFDVAGNKFNSPMVALAVTLVATVAIEGTCRLIDFCHAREWCEWIPGKDLWRTGTFVAQCFTDVVLAIFLFSFLLANDVAACPVYNVGNTSNNDLSFLFVTFVVSCPRGPTPPLLPIRPRDLWWVVSGVHGTQHGQHRHLHERDEALSCADPGPRLVWSRARVQRHWCRQRRQRRFWVPHVNGSNFHS